MKQVVYGLITRKHTLQNEVQDVASSSKIQDKIKKTFWTSREDVQGTKYHVIPLHSTYKQGRPTEQRERYVQK
jgi:hypothetical protein